MRYPTLTLSSCRELAEERLNSPDHQLNIEPQWVGEGDDLDLGPVKKAAHKCSMLIEENRSARDKDHKDGTSYTSVYGRMRSNEPAPTITTGFTTPGRGRFVHPTERRTLTPREAAVIQGFPPDYRFITEAGSPPSRSQLAKWIGDAVPMPLGYAAVLSALAAIPL